MADEQPKQDRTEQPTPKRREDARKKGDVPRSRELTMTGVMLSGASALLFASGSMTSQIGTSFAQSFQFERNNIFDPSYLSRALGDSLVNAVLGISMFAAILITAVFASAVLIGGWSFSMKAAAFKGQRINPISGFKRMFSANSAIELLKALGKFGVILFIAIVWLWSSIDELLALGRESLEVSIPRAIQICATSLLVVSCGLIVIAGIDVPFQLWNHQKKLRMTRNEIKDEFKETDGRPEVKSRIRMLQQQAAMRRMMEDVPTADVVITNPTHFAVAIQYDDEKMGAPIVVAKGTDQISARIREIANENNVPLFAAPPLARALYRSTDIGQEIPAGLYVAVAQILAYIFQLKTSGVSGSPAPERPVPDLDENLF